MGNESSKQLAAPKHLHPDVAEIVDLRQDKKALIESRDEKGNVQSHAIWDDEGLAVVETMIQRSHMAAAEFFAYAHRKRMTGTSSELSSISENFGQDQLHPFHLCQTMFKSWFLVFQSQLIKITVAEIHGEPTMVLSTVLQKNLDGKTLVQVRHEANALLVKFLAEVMTYHQVHQPSTIAQAVQVYNNTSNGNWENVNEIRPRPLDTVCLPKGQKESLLKDIDNFKLNIPRLQLLGLPCKRGYLLCGVPGTGKTSLILALAAHYKVNLAMLSLAQPGLTDNGLARLVSRAPRNTVFVIEDIDRMTVNSVVKPDSKQDHSALKDTASGVSLSCLLSVLDGTLSNSTGQIVFFTTNNPESIDPALLRPGRVDYKFQMGYAVPEQVFDIASVFWPNDPKVADKIRSLFPVHRKDHKITTAAVASALVGYMNLSPEQVMQLDIIEW